MAYAAVIFLSHNIQRLLDCTVSIGATEEDRRSKIKALCNQIIEKKDQIYLEQEYEPELKSGSIELELKDLNNVLRRMDGSISRRIVAETKSLANALERLDGARNRSINWSCIDQVDAEIRVAVWQLEDVLQCYSFDGTLLSYRGRTPRWRHYPVGQYIDSFLLTLKKLGEKYNKALDGVLLPKEEEEEEEEDDCISAAVDGCGSKRPTTVGTSDQLERIVNELLDHQPRLKTVSLFGMAGIGKTHHPLVIGRFDLLVWVRVGPRQQLKNVWADVIAQVEGKPKGMFMETSIITLVDLLTKSLSEDRRYLIVLDDVWSSEVCDCLIRLLVSHGNRTRVLVTTRLEDVANYFESSIHQRPFLSDEESWDLLWRNVFDEEDVKSFPPQLEEAGRKIAEKCEGLPLLIIAVADILCGLNKTLEYWNEVADEKTTTFTDAYDKIAKVLFSSYEYLPQYLKPCFLYMGVFPQRCKIAVSELIYLLTAEDFMESERCQLQIVRTRRKDCDAKPMKSSAFNMVLNSMNAEDFMELLSMFPSPPRKRRVEVSEQQLPKTSSSTPRRIAYENRRMLLQPRRRIAYVEQEQQSRTCKFTKAFETLYLLEPGPAPTRFITPFEKIDSKQFRVPEADPLKEESSSDSETVDEVATIENFVMECLERLVSNSLAIVCKQSSRFRIKSCKLHSAYWHLCVKEARRTKFFHVMNKLRDTSEECIKGQRRLSVQNSVLLGIKEVYNSVAAAFTARSLLITSEDHRYPVPIVSNLVRLRVLDALAIRFYAFPTEVLKLLQLMYLSLTHNGEVPSSITKLTQLQFFAVRRHHNIKLPRNSNCLPENIWDMHQLTHLWIMGSYLPNPGPDARLPNLYALHIDARGCREDVFRSIPYLKKLAVRIELHPVATAETEICCLEHITLLNELESLKCVVFNPRLEPRAVAPANNLLDLPAGLKKLSLNGLGYPWEYMSVIGSLPNLQVLKLRFNAFRGAEWETKSGEFMRLEFLSLEDIDLVHWTIDDDDDDVDDCFHNLRRLIIRHCYKLKRIPLSISTLETLEVVDCSPAIVEQVHQDANYSSVQLVIKSSWKV